MSISGLAFKPATQVFIAIFLAFTPILALRASDEKNDSADYFDIDIHSAIDEDTLNLTMQNISEYFLAPYRHRTALKEVSRIIHSQNYRVNRPNHGLAHGLRQGLLASNIFILLTNYSEQDDLVPEIITWAKEKQQSNQKWVEKICFASAFQRTGRQSEVSSIHDFDRYCAYERQDALNFLSKATSLDLFSDATERDDFADAILWSNKPRRELTRDTKYLQAIFHAAHILDLRRMLSFDGERILKDAMTELFGTNQPIDVEKLKKTLWEMSGEYLLRTGDRDLVTQRTYLDTFFIQSNNPSLMVKALMKKS